MANINVPGLLAIIFFYVLILAVGIWAGRKTGAGKEHSADVSVGEQSNIMLAGRNIGLFVGVFTMTATWVGGGYINGTAETVYNYGLVYCQAPFGYAISLAIGGKLFAVKMRQAGYKTMLDPFQNHYGSRMGGLLFIPALCGEVFWSAAILSALGATVDVIVDLGREPSIIASACIALFYTFTGGLYSVAYTDVVQLGAIFVGLWLCVPFAMFNQHVGKISYPTNDYIGTVDLKFLGKYIDDFLLLMMGGIPWQVYFQRVLSSKTAEGAELLSYMASLGCLFMAVPPIVLGAVAKSANFTLAGYAKASESFDAALTLPLVLQYLTPGFVSAVGLGAVSAAVMSSSDSSILSAASMFSWNIYRLTIHQGASDKEVIWVMRLGIILVGALATGMALTVTSVYSLWFLSGDLVYVLLFPQLVSVVYFKDYVNTYGSLAAFLVGIFLRAGGGEASFGIPVFIRFPFYDEEEGQLFPFRTFIMLLCFVALLAVSGITQILFNGLLPLQYDIFKCFTPLASVAEKPTKEQRALRRQQQQQQQQSTTQESQSQCERKESEVVSHPTEIRSIQPREVLSSQSEQSATAEKQPDVFTESPETVSVAIDKPATQPSRSSKGSKKRRKRKSSKAVVSTVSQDDDEQ